MTRQSQKRSRTTRNLWRRPRRRRATKTGEKMHVMRPSLISHLPDQSYFLVLFRRGRHRTRDCWIQGARGRPEEVISQINHIFVYSSGEADIEQETAGYKGHVEGQKKSTPRSIIFSCTPQERQTSNKRLLDTRGTWKARGSHLLSIMFSCTPQEKQTSNSGTGDSSLVLEMPLTLCHGRVKAHTAQEQHRLFHQLPCQIRVIHQR